MASNNEAVKIFTRLISDISIGILGDMTTDDIQSHYYLKKCEDGTFILSAFCIGANFQHLFKQLEDMVEEDVKKDLLTMGATAKGA